MEEKVLVPLLRLDYRVYLYESFEECMASFNVVLECYPEDNPEIVCSYLDCELDYMCDDLFGECYCETIPYLI